MSESDFHGRRSLNRRAALILFGVLVALGVGVHFLHAFQVGRNARELLAEADRAEQNGDPLEAIDYLSQYLNLAPKDGDARIRFGLLLAQEARTAQDRGRAFVALEKALQAAPQREDVRLQAINLALSIGGFHDARGHVEVLLAGHAGDPDLTALLGLCELGEGQLTAGQEHLRQAVERSPGPKDPQVYLQYALLLRERGHDVKKADEVMRGAPEPGLLIKRQGRSPAARVAASAYARRFGRLDEAAEHLRITLEELKVRDAGLFLEAAEVAQLRGKSDEARARLEAGAKQAPQDPRLPLELARLDVRQGKPNQARKRLAPLVKDPPRSAGELWKLGGLLIDCGDLDHADDVIARLERVGEVPAARCLKARQLMERREWAEAKGLLEQVRSATAVAAEVRQRTNLLLAICYKQLGNPDQQLAACQRVLADAPGSAQARHLLASALAALDRREEAIVEYRKILDRVPAAVPELAGLLLASNLALPPGKRSWDELKGLLARLKKENSTAAQGALLEARVWAAQGRHEEAREVLEKERQRDPKQVEPWLLLAALAEQEGKRDSIPALLDEAERQAGRRVEWDLARTDYWLRAGPEKARKELPGVEARLDRLTGVDRQRLTSALATAYEALGKKEQAEKLLRASLAEKPNDPGRLWRLADFYVRGEQHAKAEPLLRRLIAPQMEASAATAWARRALALFLARDGSYAHFKQAEALLAPQGRDKVETQQDVPTRALVLATRPEHRRTAIGLIEGLSQRQLATRPEVQFMLAQLYDKEGKWPQAKGQLLLLLQAQPKNPRYLVHAIQAFLDHEQGAEATRWLECLAALRPDASETVVLRAKVLEKTGTAKAAEEVYRKHAQGSKDPTGVLPLAEYLGRRGEVAEALALCEKAWKKCRPEAVAATTAAVLRSPDASDDQRRQGEERLSAALAANPRSHLLALYLASVQEMRGRYREAVQVYRRILRQDPGNTLALNNLAYYLALTEGNSEEALGLIGAALERAGPDAELLDTRALVLLSAGRAEAAVNDLEQVVAQVPTAVHYFHLALAYKQADRPAPERAAVKKARALGFKVEQLLQLERRLWREMAEECAGKEEQARAGRPGPG